MSEFDFDIPTRFDTKVADEGVWFRVRDENGAEYGEFLCALIDKHNPRTTKIYERFNVRYKKLKDTPGYEKKLGADVFIELSLIDWKLKNKKGVNIPYSRDAAMAYLLAAPFVLEALGAFAGDVTNYAGLAIEPAIKN